MPVSIKISGIDKLSAKIKSMPDNLSAGVKITGPAASYAEVWEFGKISCNPGPKTMWSTNIDGEEVVLTKTAPHGYIRVHKTTFRQYFREELTKAKLHTIPFDEWGDALGKVMDETVIRCAILIADSAPIDTGALKGAIEPVSSKDNTAGSTFSINIGG
jgi:hypothetical protein